MPRTTDSPWETTKHVPLGAPLTPQTPSTPVSKPKPEGPSGIVSEDGRMRTTHHPAPK